jgi:hypothetical protein
VGQGDVESSDASGVGRKVKSCQNSEAFSFPIGHLGCWMKKVDHSRPILTS